MRLVLATLVTYRKMAETLTECGYEDRLLSFYLLDKIPDEVLHCYVETGLPLHHPKKKKGHWNQNQYLRERRIYLVKRIKEYESTVDGI